MEFNANNLAWAAGLFDGEGCVRVGYNLSPSGVYHNIQLSVNQKDIGVLNKFRGMAAKRHKRRKILIQLLSEIQCLLLLNSRQTQTDF